MQIIDQIIDQLGANDLDAVRALLLASALPADDIDDPAIVLFGIREGATLLGVGGLQLCDDTALLRSLAVRPEMRSRGIGNALCEHAIAQAIERSLARICLLTTGAADYFSRRGFTAIPRDEAPPSIRTTSQFTSLCPASAVVMVRALRP